MLLLSGKKKTEQEEKIEKDKKIENQETFTSYFLLPKIPTKCFLRKENDKYSF